MICVAVFGANVLVFRPIEYYVRGLTTRTSGVHWLNYGGDGEDTGVVPSPSYYDLSSVFFFISPREIR